MIDRFVWVMALEPDPAVARLIRDALADDERLRVASVVPDEARLLDEVAKSRPEVVLVDIAGTLGQVAAAIRAVLAAAPETCVIVTGADTPPAVVSRAVTAGARGFLLKPFEGRDLVATISDAYHNLAELRRLQRQDRGGPGMASERGAVLAVYSPKGGVGCTTIATNLAIALRTKTKRGVAILDLDLQFGDVGVALDLRSANSIADLITHVDGIDATLIADVFVKHESGISALLAPDTLGFVESLHPERIIRAIDSLRNHFDYIVCDLWSSLDDLTLGTLRGADRIVLVTTPELPSLKNLRRVIGATTPLLIDDRTQVVVNRHPARAGVSLPDIEKSLGRAVAGSIPSEGVGVTEAINQGISIFDARARVRASRAYTRLADLVLRGLTTRTTTEVERATTSA
ncbi:MAG: AAA family ATPase [Candidatus Limnocylindria bacterium]